MTNSKSLETSLKYKDFSGKCENKKKFFPFAVLRKFAILSDIIKAEYEILETDTPTIDLVLSDNIFTAKAQIEAWSCVSRITTSSGKIVVYCYDLSPTTEIQIQTICIR